MYNEVYIGTYTALKGVYIKGIYYDGSSVHVLVEEGLAAGDLLAVRHDPRVLRRGSSRRGVVSVLLGVRAGVILERGSIVVKSKK